MLDKSTKGMLWRVTQGQYDQVGLLSAYTIRLKLLMQNMQQENSKVIGWDEEVPASANDFHTILEDVKALREITFPRCIQPPEAKMLYEYIGIIYRYRGIMIIFMGSSYNGYLLV